jgi:O-antigen ligase
MILLDEIPNPGLKGIIIQTKKWIEPFILFFVMFNILDDKKTCKKVLFGLGILLFITALGGPLTSSNIINIGRAVVSGRASGFGDANSFAAYLVLFIPLVLTYVLFHKSNTLRTFSVVVLFATFFALIFSGSRGGILSAVASIFGYLFMLYMQKAIRLRSLFSVALIVIMVSTISFFLAPPKVKKMASRRIDPAKSESVEDFSAGRLMIWRRSISLFAERPIFGHGYNSIIYLMETRFGYGAAAHNRYLNYLVELGIIGCGLYIMILLKVFQIIWTYQKITPDFWERKLYIGYIAGLLGFAFSMLFVNVGQPRYIFWFYTAIFLRYGQLRKNGEDETDFAFAGKRGY